MRLFLRLFLRLIWVVLLRRIRRTGVTFWLAFQYQLFNYAYWSWLPLASASSAQTIGQSQCIFVFFFSVVILDQPFSVIKLVLCVLCVSGVTVLTFGDRAQPTNGSDGSGSESAEPSETGSMSGDLLLLLPSICNALYAVEWKRLVPGTDARDSLVGLVPSTPQNSSSLYSCFPQIDFVRSSFPSGAACGLAFGVLDLGHPPNRSLRDKRSR